MTIARIGAIAARADSPHDGEALNSVRLLTRELGKLNLKLSDLVVGMLAAPASVSACQTRCASHQDLAAKILRAGSLRTPREALFLRGIARSSSCSQAQMAWLMDLARRHGCSASTA